MSKTKFESTYKIITETSYKNLRKIYWDITLYIKALDGESPSEWFKDIIESSINFELNCDEKLKIEKISLKEEIVELFDAEKHFCYTGLSKSELLNHQKQFFSDLLNVKQFAIMYNKMVISAYAIWCLIGARFDVSEYKAILGGESI